LATLVLDLVCSKQIVHELVEDESYRKHFIL
jgi:hypothetical protein